MAALWISSSTPQQGHRLVLPTADSASSALGLVRQALAEAPPGGAVWLDTRDWALTLADLVPIQQRLQEAGLVLEGVSGEDTGTLVAAAALALQTRLTDAPATAPGPELASEPLRVHRGTLRAGEHLQVAGSLLVLGDVNPGARVSAAGHVLVWGRLRGLAHAGCQGDGDSRIIALQLHPLQLRIATAVARGPEERPPVGLAEQAVLQGNQIRIEPAPPQWPLD